MRRTCLLLALSGWAACSSGGAGLGRDLAVPLPDAAAGTSEDAGIGDGGDGGSRDASAARDGGSGGPDLRPSPDLLPAPDLAWSGIFAVRVLANNFCKLSSTPTTLAVPAGTSFKVTWTNLASSSYNIDIDKIDMFNQVPLIIGLEPGMSWTDTRDWCGIFTGKFNFRIRVACDTYYIPVDCNK